MEEMLLRNGFLKTENPNEYVKGNWIARLDKDIFEIFNDPDKSPGKYYCGLVSIIDLETILYEIENFEFNLASGKES